MKKVTNRRAHTLVPFSPEWKTFVADAAEKEPKARTLEEREALKLAQAEPEERPFGIRCERDGTGVLSPGVAWFKAGGVLQQYATQQTAEQVALSLNQGALPCCRYEARAFADGLGEPPPAPPAAVAPAGPNVTCEEFVQWARDHKGLAEAVVQAQALAQTERARVHKYILPLLASFDLRDSENGNQITDPDKLYLCDDEERVQEFYARADEAHRAHGFTGEPGVWPDLEADQLQTYAEQQLLLAACKFFGMQRHPIGKMREKFLKLTLSACLNSPAFGGQA